MQHNLLAGNFEPGDFKIPRLSVPFPTLNEGKLSAVAPPGVGETRVAIPWIGEYFAAGYQYFVGVAVILSIILFMVGGIRYMTSHGSSESISKAKEMISHAALGMVLALGSYLILYTINPELVEFKALTVQVVSTDPIEDITIIDHEAASAPYTPEEATHIDEKAKQSKAVEKLEEKIEASGADWQSTINEIDQSMPQ